MPAFARSCPLAQPLSPEGNMSETDPLGNPDPLYLQVRDILTQRIEDGTYTLKIPPEYDLSLEFGVSHSTVRRAVQMLKDDGLLISKPAHGTFITAQALSLDGGGK
jgi:GntR family transcriptional regulator